jgi:hypothetical protein
LGLIQIDEISPERAITFTRTDPVAEMRLIPR